MHATRCIVGPTLHWAEAGMQDRAAAVCKTMCRSSAIVCTVLKK